MHKLSIEKNLTKQMESALDKGNIQQVAYYAHRILNRLSKKNPAVSDLNGILNDIHKYNDDSDNNKKKLLGDIRFRIGGVFMFA